MLDKIFKTMLIFVPIAVIAHIYNFSPLVIFIVSAVAIIPLAKYIGEATEELSVYTGPALGGLLNATFGNATELIIGILALQAGLIDVVKASITGSIIGNLLLVLGSAIFFGGINRKEQKFNATAAQTSGSTLLLAIIALVVPAIFLQTTSSASNAPLVEKLSIVVAIIMIISYLASLIFSLYTHKHLYTEDVGKNEAKWSIKKSVIILLISTIVVAFMSDYLVGVIQPLVTNFGWTQLFIGVIFVAIIGNAAEHTSAITMAVKGKMDLALQVAIGSATQMAILVAPALVLVSLFFQTQMNLVFSTFELVAMVFSVFVVNAVIEDGSSNWFEGFQLLAAYIIMAVAFFFHP
jgi:Ca2+:H+ antiporter